MGSERKVAEQSAEELLAEMRARAETEREQLLAAADAAAREIEARSRREAEGIEGEASVEVDAELAKERDRVLGAVRDGARSERLELKRSAIREVFDEAAREIERRIGGDGYERALASLIREGSAAVGAGAALTVSAEDLELAARVVAAEGLDCRVTGCRVARGSVVLASADGRRRVENGLRTRLARAEGRLAAEVAHLLFGRR